MGTALKELLIATPPRERSGSLSNNRFQYQVDWALCHILELHAQGGDYVVVFDFHDDVVVLDSATDPLSVIFYQVKTKDGGVWTTTQLLSRKTGGTGKLPSILGKLYENYELAAAATNGLCIVSNAAFDIPLANGLKPSSPGVAAYGDFAAKEQETIKGKLKVERNLNSEPAGIVHLRCITSDLSMHGHVDHAFGKLTAFVDQLPGYETTKVGAFFRTLKMELERLATSEQMPNSFADLCSFKAISRSRFEAMLEQVQASPPAPQWPEIIRAQLRSEGVGVSKISKLVKGATQFVANRFDPTNTVLNEGEQRIRDYLRAHDIEVVRLADAMEAIFAELAPTIPQLIEQFDETYVRAMIGVLLHEEQELSSPHSNAEDETP